MPSIGNTNELLELLGVDDFRRLVEVRGGTALRVPTSLAAAERLVQWVGEAATGKLVEAYAGFTIDVPNLKATPAYDHRIKPLLGRMTDSEIAITVGCTERTVRSARARLTGNLPGGTASRPAHPVAR